MQNTPFPKSRGRLGAGSPVPFLKASIFRTGFSFQEIRLIAMGFLALVTVLVYLPGLFHEVVDLDYSCWVRAALPLELHTLKEVFCYDGARWKELGYFAPLTAASFMVDLWLGGTIGHQEVVHKVVNLLLHLLNTYLVLRLVRLLGFREWVSFTVAAIFALHPLQVTSLEWIPERKNLLMTCFFLSGTVLYCRFRSTHRSRDYFGLLGCFVAALLCKPAAVVFGPCLILTDALLLDRRITARAFLRSAPFLVLGLVWGVVAMKTELGITQAPALLERLLVAPYQMVFLAGKFFVPVDLTLLYPHPHPVLSSWVWWMPALGFVACLGLTVRGLYSEAYRGVVWGTAFYVVNLVPSSGIVPFSGMKELWAADHYQYLAIIGLGLAATLAVEAVTGRLGAAANNRIGLGRSACGPMAGRDGSTQIRKGGDRCGRTATSSVNETGANDRYSRLERNSNRSSAGRLHGRTPVVICSIATATVVIFMSVLSSHQVEIWSGPESLWTHVIRKNPESFMGYLNYGSYAYEKGRYREAEQMFRKALSMNEQYVESYRISYTLGLLSERRGAQDQAVQDLYKALELNPRHGESHLALSRLMFGRGAFPQSLEHCRHAEQLGTPCNQQNLRKLIAAESFRMPSRPENRN